jgi:hypothetical protein
MALPGAYTPVNLPLRIIGTRRRPLRDKALVFGEVLSQITTQNFRAIHEMAAVLLPDLKVVCSGITFIPNFITDYEFHIILLREKTHGHDVIVSLGYFLIR